MKAPASASENHADGAEKLGRVDTLLGLFNRIGQNRTHALQQSRGVGKFVCNARYSSSGALATFQMASVLKPSMNRPLQRRIASRACLPVG